MGNLTLKGLINYSKKYTEMLYFDTMDIYRFAKGKNPDGTDKRGLELLYKDIPCSLSISQLQTDNPNKTSNITQDVLWRPKVICGPDVDVIAGDKIIVYNEQKTFEGTASDVKPFKKHHIEFSIGIEKEA